MITIPGKIPIKIHPLFWLIAFFVGWIWTFSFANAILAIVVIFFSVLFHEFGHALTAIAFGQKTRIELAAFGGFTYREGRRLKLWEEFLVVLNGPLTGFILLLISFFALRHYSIQNKSLLFVLQFTFAANFFWTIVNLVPVLPLDGGHLLSIVLESIFGFKGVKMAIVIGIAIAIGISIYCFVSGNYLLGALFLILTFESFRSLRYYKIFSEKDRDTDLQQLMKSADNDFQSGKDEAAISKLNDVRDQAKEGILFTLATQELAEIYKTREKYEEAYQLLLPIERSLTGEHLALFHFLTYVNGDYERTVEIGNKVYQDNPSPDTALINSLACAVLEKIEPAVGWFECAVREGLQSPKEVSKREEFDSIRENPQFKEIIDNL